MNFVWIFITGLTTGGLSCLAMQGGLLASVIANQKDDLRGAEKSQPSSKKDATSKTISSSMRLLSSEDWLPVLMFLGTKLVSHTILGFFLGWVGSAITLNLGTRLFFQVFTAFFMFATAMNLLNVHPIFRYVSFQPPKFLQRIIRNSTKSRTLFAPGVLGFLTIFVPCGVTQAMEVVAINSGNPVAGALILFSFVLGTSPLFAVLGLATAKLSVGWYEKFTKVAAISLIAMAIFAINGVLLVLDSPLTLNKLVSPVTYFFSAERFTKNLVATDASGVQQVKIQVLNNGYQPNKVTVKAGVPVEITLESHETYSCALGFVLKEFNINTVLASTDTQSFTFTPNKPGSYRFTCQMGMYSGIFEVI